MTVSSCESGLLASCEKGESDMSPFFILLSYSSSEIGIYLVFRGDVLSGWICIVLQEGDVGSGESESEA